MFCGAYPSRVDLNWAAVLSVSKRRITVLLPPGAGWYVQTSTEALLLADASPTSRPSVDLMSDGGARSHVAVLLPPPPEPELADVDESGPQPVSEMAAPASAAMIRSLLMTV